MLIWLSLSQHDALHHIPPGWFDRVALAALTLAITQFLSTAMLLAWWLSRVQLVVRLSGFAPFTLLFLIATYAAINGAARMLLVVSDNALPQHIQPWRKLAAVAAVLSLAVGAAYVIFSLRLFVAYLFRWGLYSNWEWSVGLALVGSSAAALAYLRQLAIMMRRRRAMHVCEWLLLIPGLMVVFALPWTAPVSVRPLGRIVPYAMLVYLPISGLLLFWLAWACRKAAANAHELWKSESAA